MRLAYLAATLADVGAQTVNNDYGPVQLKYATHKRVRVPTNTPRGSWQFLGS